MADFFLWLEAEEQPIRRLVVNQEVAGRLTPIFQGGTQALLGTQELIQLSAEPFQPDETEAWMIEEFDFPVPLQEAIENPIGVPQVTHEIEGNRVRCLIASGLGEDGDAVGFQVVDRRQLLTQRVLGLILDGDTFKRIQDPGLLVGDDVHVALAHDRLVFRSLWWARRVFDLEAYYVEATQEQMDVFMQRADIRVETEGFAESASQWERKRISYLVQSGLLDQTTPLEVREKAAVYGIQVGVEPGDAGDQIVVPDDSVQRKALLKFLEEDYYVGPITETKFVANSKRKV